MIDLDIIKQHEGLSLKAYKCPANVPTIGYGNTFYEDGSRVNMGDVITLKQAHDLLLNISLKYFLQNMKLPEGLSDNQKSALLSLVYNIGLGAWNKSTIRRKVLANPHDATITAEFMKWDKAGGKKLKGLTTRRAAEAKLYFK